jgi:hypothetical protein
MVPAQVAVGIEPVEDMGQKLYIRSVKPPTPKTFKIYLRGHYYEHAENQRHQQP